MKKLLLVIAMMIFPLLAMAQAPTIAQLKTQSPESLWHFLAQLPNSIEAQIFYGVLLFGVIAMIGSYIVKYARGQATCSIFGYFFQTQWRLTLLSVCTYIGTMAAGIGTGVFFTTVDGADVFVGWYAVIWSSLTTAFSCDMGINRGNEAKGS